MGNPLELWYHTAMVLYDRCDMFTVTQTVLCLANEKVELQHNSELNEGVGVIHHQSIHFRSNNSKNLEIFVGSLSVLVSRYRYTETPTQYNLEYRYDIR